MASGETNFVVLASDYYATESDSELAHPSIEITCDTVLDLNGHTIDTRGYFRAFIVSNGGRFTLTNSVPESGSITGYQEDGDAGGVIVNAGGVFTMNGGAITNNVSSDYGGGVYVEEGGTFTMNDGLISGNVAEWGGGVSVDDGGTFTMNSGLISCNSASEGGGIYVYGTATLNAGEISDNRADGVGGGVVNEGLFTMVGGTISNNQAEYSAGVEQLGEFLMSGGSISGNCALKDGGGVYVNEDSEFTMSGGIIIGNIAKSGGGVRQNGSMFVYGSPVVDENFDYNDATNNVYVVADECYSILVPEGFALTEGAWIGVSLEDPPDEEGVLIASGESEDVGSFFFSDNPKYVKSTVKLGEDEYQVYLGVTQTQYPSYLDNADDTTMAYYNAWAEKYGADTNGTHETAFLLNVPQDRAVHEDEGESYLKVVDFKFTNNVLHIELASDACDLFQRQGDIGSAALCNGILTLEMSTDLGSFNSSASGHGFLSVPVTINANTGTANVDYYINDNYNIPSLFVRPLITVEYYAPKE